MRIGLIDVDGTGYPNLPLMKLSAWHKAQGDTVEWYDPLFSGHMDKVYLSKVFSFTPDFIYNIDADEVVRRGSGYAIKLEDGKEVFDKTQDTPLPYEVEHIYPDYSLYGITDTAYGFLTRGCPRACSFCHVEAMQGRKSVKVADLSEFWRGQKNVVLFDANILACKQWRELMQRLIDSGAWVDFNQGLDIRLMTPEKAEMIGRIKIRNIHFAWDQYGDIDKIVPKLREFKEITGIDKSKLGVYVLCGFDTTIEQDLERIYTLRDLGYSPYVMLYNKDNIPRGHVLRRLMRWCNNRIVFGKVKDFNDYDTRR